MVLNIWPNGCYLFGQMVVIYLVIRFWSNDPVSIVSFFLHTNNITSNQGRLTKRTKKYNVQYFKAEIVETTSVRSRFSEI